MKLDVVHVVQIVCGDDIVVGVRRNPLEVFDPLCPSELATWCYVRAPPCHIYVVPSKLKPGCRVHDDRPVKWHVQFTVGDWVGADERVHTTKLLIVLVRVEESTAHSVGARVKRKTTPTVKAQHLKPLATQMRPVDAIGKVNLAVHTSARCLEQWLVARDGCGMEVIAPQVCEINRQPLTPLLPFSRPLADICVCGVEGAIMDAQLRAYLRWAEFLHSSLVPFTRTQLAQQESRIALPPLVTNHTTTHGRHGGILLPLLHWIAAQHLPVRLTHYQLSFVELWAL
mmetsp:Transcript_75174/g.125350  ORF Transcript_75174/g.125350 Transcript_75174/m.125350 type:complete len:284 (+) Transcript_75174:1163-2014(+)